MSINSYCKKTKYFRISLAIYILSAVVLMGCIKNNQKKPEAKEDKTDQGDPSDSDGDGTPNSDPIGVDDDDGVGDDTNDDDAANALEALLEECGAKDVANLGDDAVILEKTISSVPKVMRLLVSTITVNTDVAIKVTKKISIQDAKVDIQMDPPIAIDLLEGFMGKNKSGKIISENVPFDEYTSLSSHKAWDGILCTFVPAKKLENQRGGNTVVEFEPPMPLNISPKASAKRFSAEIGEKKIFDNIKVKIISTNSLELSGKKEVVGHVIVEKVSPTTAVEDGNGGQIEIKADLAYKVSMNFETPEVTTAMGLSPEMTYYIDHNKKDFVANILDTKSLLTGKVVFLHK